MITDLTRRAQFDISSSVPSSFTFTFWFYSPAEFVAVVTLADGTDQVLVNGVDYSITDPGAGGTLARLSTWPATAQTLTLYRLTALTQEADFRNGDNSDAETLEVTLDRMVAMLQENADNSAHGIYHPLTDPEGLNLAVPPVALRANRYLAWDTAGNVMAVDGVAATGTANAAQLDGYHAGHTFGTIPISDGVECVGLIASRANNVVHSTNIAMGPDALSSETGALSNIAIGLQALKADTTGSYNIAIGYQALLANTIGMSNIAIGYESLKGNTTGANNLAIGYRSLTENTTGGDLVAIGQNALAANTTGHNNIAIGYQALAANTTGTYNLAIGYNSLASNISGIGNIAIGYQSLTANTDGSNLVAIGQNALTANTTGHSNVAIGYHALAANTAGKANTAIGFNALAANTTGMNNVAIGEESLPVNTTGANNVAIGAHALYADTYGYSNIAIGYGALQTCNGGSSNVAIGFAALNNITTGTDNIGIGPNCTTASPTSDNSITLGNSWITSLRCNVTSISALSDRRDKADIEDITIGLDFINALHSRSWHWDRREWYENGIPDGSKKKSTRDYGYIAQELQDIQREFGVDLHLVLEDNPEKLEAAPGYLLPVMVRAIQELSARISALEEKVNA
jgi:hypothetical protein